MRPGRVAAGLALAALALACGGGGYRAPRPSDPLLAAAAAGNLAALHARIEAGDDIHATARGGASALHLAANGGHVALLEPLVAAGAAVDAAEFDGDTALHNAAVLGRAEVVERLLELGADPTIKSSATLTAAQHARRAGHTAIARRLDGAQRDWARADRPGSASAYTPSVRPSAPTESRRARDYGAGYGRRIAAVIGINDYRRWPELAGAVPDAKNVARMFRENGFDEVLELYERDATREGILDLLGRRLPEQAGAEDLAVIFFAGHGATETLPDDSRRGYIVPVEADTERVFSTAISMNELRDLAARIPAKHVYYVMDSCYSGLLLTRGLRLLSADTPNYFQKVTSKPSVQIITAGSAGEEAVERDGAGVFTTHFLAALRGGADANGDGYVTSEEISVYVKPRVSDESDNAQTPVFGTIEGDGEIVFPIAR